MSESGLTHGSFSEVHVVSDLHLGGRRDFQIFAQTVELTALIEHLIARDTERAVFVMNGDIVDFLAEEPAAYLDPAGAVGKLERIVTQEFAPVWSALRKLVATPGRYLALVLGNHDVELALPHVRAWLTHWLCQGDDAVRGRILWAVDGAGFTCEVGGRRVLCVHGNEVDDWNVINHRALLDVARHLNRQTAASGWVPNAGTRLVVDVMNEIKRQFPMVDLLKPETSATVPMLLAMEPSLALKTGRALRAASRKVWDGVRMTAGFLGDEEVDESERPSPAEALLSVAPQLLSPNESSSNVAELAMALQRRIDRGGSPRVAAAEGEEFLGITDWLSPAKRPEALRNALVSWLDRDNTWDVRTKDKTFSKLDKAVGGGVHYLLAGHTHLRRAIPRDIAGCYYYNTGTWIRLIRLDKAILADPAQFQAILAALKSSQMSTLDAATYVVDQVTKSLVQNQPTVASIYEEGASAYGVLQEFQQGELVALKGTRFPEKAGG